MKAKYKVKKNIGANPQNVVSIFAHPNFKPIAVPQFQFVSHPEITDEATMITYAYENNDLQAFGILEGDRLLASPVKSIDEIANQLCVIRLLKTGQVTVRQVFPNADGTALLETDDLSENLSVNDFEVESIVKRFERNLIQANYGGIQ